MEKEDGKRMRADKVGELGEKKIEARDTRVEETGN